MAKRSERFTCDELNRLAHAWTTEAVGGCSGAATPDPGSGLDPYGPVLRGDDLGNLMSGPGAALTLVVSGYGRMPVYAFGRALTGWARRDAVAED
ncbi:hypothetical protein ABZ079_03165 [Streptomyces sp. NPDC006314]|uniref:hypothetical protein n=1 Tax=Streptomyces sp. NPDC006314 TaxID=3154475 RepID=UPI0033A699DB